jgi:hypothetical protein
MLGEFWRRSSTTISLIANFLSLIELIVMDFVNLALAQIFRVEV